MDQSSQILQDFLGHALLHRSHHADRDRTTRTTICCRADCAPLRVQYELVLRTEQATLLRRSRSL